MKHLDDNDRLDYLEGEGSREFVDHLVSCVDCQARVDAERAFEDAVATQRRGWIECPLRSCHAF